MFDSSHEREPLEFIVGKGKVIPGFDDIVIGMVKGERTKERIEAEKAYGKTTQSISHCVSVCITVSIHSVPVTALHMPSGGMCNPLDAVL